MKIALASDLHLEFGDITLKNDGQAEVLVLSGDVCVATCFKEPDSYIAKSVHNFFKRVSQDFPHVIYIAGNHEHYNGDYVTTIQILKETLSVYTNIHVLEKESFELDDTVFLCGTLWTDMNKSDPNTLLDIKHYMNDFKIIRNSSRTVTRKVPIYKKNLDGTYIHSETGYHILERQALKQEPSLFLPTDMVEDHVKMLDFISTSYDSIDSKKIVVVGHHTPSTLSLHPKYAGNFTMNGGYHSDLSEFILDRPRIKLWTHGHTHDEFDYMLGETRVVCNPRGYHGIELSARSFKLKYLEI